MWTQICLVSTPSRCNQIHLSKYCMLSNYRCSYAATLLHTDIQSVIYSYSFLQAPITSNPSDLYRMECSRITPSLPAVTWARHATHSRFHYRCQQRKKDRGSKTSSCYAIAGQPMKSEKNKKLNFFPLRPTNWWYETQTGTCGASMEVWWQCRITTCWQPQTDDQWCETPTWAWPKHQYLICHECFWSVAPD